MNKKNTYPSIEAIDAYNLLKDNWYCLCIDCTNQSENSRFKKYQIKDMMY